MIVTFLLMFAGLALLVLGAEWLVKGASRLALSFGISSLVVGLTVVAYGTSAPEMSVSVMSSLQGKSEMAAGNIIGSNIFNILFILGISALVAPLIVDRQLIRLDVPVMILASLIMVIMCSDGVISRWDGLVLFGGAVFYTYWLIRMSRRKNLESKPNAPLASDPVASPESKPWMNLIWIVAGLGLLILGSRWLVDSAIVIARVWGMSETIIGLTIIAAGTSLPEVATSVIASFRGERDIAVGNVVGSNVFNILSVGGLSGLVADQGLSTSNSMIRFDLPFMLAVAVACFPIFLRGFVITRTNGLFFLAYYIAYTSYLILGATNHDALPIFSKVMFEFIAPLTGVMLVSFLVFEWRLHRRKGIDQAES